MIQKEKHMKNVKRAKESMMENLETIVLKGFNDFMDISKDFVTDVITTFFEDKKPKKVEKK